VSISNNPPDVVLNLTHEQATFLLENCSANRLLALALIMSIGEDKTLTLAQKRAKADGIVKMNEDFGEIMKLLRGAGAVEKED
jgi:hypothetical protein